MNHWSVDEKKFKKENPEGYKIWKLEQMINYGELGERISERRRALETEEVCGDYNPPTASSHSLREWAPHSSVYREPKASDYVLKVVHPGSLSSALKEFLTTVNPHVAAISVGNAFGFSSPEVIERLRKEVGENLFLTLKDGTIEFITDDQRL